MPTHRPKLDAKFLKTFQEDAKQLSHQHWAAYFIWKQVADYHRVRFKLPGTIVHEACRREAQDRLQIRIGHPAGVIETESAVELNENDYEVKRATLGRTTRRIMEGTVYID